MITTPRLRSRFLLFFHHLNVFLKQFFLYFEVEVADINFDIGAMNFGASNDKVSSYYNRKLQLPFTKVHSSNIKVDISNFDFKIQEKLLEKHIEVMEKEQETRSEPWGSDHYTKLVWLFICFFSLHTDTIFARDELNSGIPPLNSFWSLLLIEYLWTGNIKYPLILYPFSSFRLFSYYCLL